MNLYITGLNQLTDIEIDKINKPYLPLASGALSYSHGLFIVLGSFFAALKLTSPVSYPLKMTVVGSAIFGTIYSLPPFRLKRFPLLAAICIVAVRGSLVNLGFYLQAKTAVMGIPVGNSLMELMKTATSQFPESVAATAFFAVFGTIIAIMKDIPDIVGDRLFSIPSFSVKLGAKRVFAFAWQLLFSLLSLSAFACSASVVPTLLQVGANRVTVGNLISRLACSVVLFALSKDVRKRASVVKPEDSDSVFKYYMQMWNIFYACYIILPFLR
jgi:homogentisate phytyltransferase/homogentisate geranylgeranyltransferase